MNAVKFALLGLVGVIGLVISTFGPFKIPYAETLAKTYYRHAIAGLLVVLFLLSGLVAVAVHTLNPNQFKSQIVEYVQQRTQRELTLDGELELTWFPKLGFKSGRASLSQHRSAREFASLDSARITIAWLPLLRRQVQIDRAEVDGLRAQLARFKDGSTNIDDLLRDIGAISPAHIDLQSVHLTRATLLWNDEIGLQRGTLNDLQIELGRLTDGLVAPLTASVRIDAPHAGIDARLALKGRLLFDAAERRIELAKIDAQLDGQALGVDNLAMNLKADVTGHLGLNTLRVENAVMTTSSKSGLSVFNARIASPELRVVERKFQGSQLSMDLSIAHPDRTLTAALQVPSFEAAGRTLRSEAASAQLSIRGSAATHLRAQMTSPVALDLDAGPRLEFEAIELTGEAIHPALRAQAPLSASGKLVFELAQKSAQLSLAGKFAGNDLRGRIALSEWRRPIWNFDLASNGLDLDALLAQPCLAGAGDDAAAFDMAFLRELTLTGQLRADKIKLCGLGASNVAATFDAQRAVLHIAPITAQLYGGSVDAVLGIDAAAVPSVTTTGTVSDVHLRAAHADGAQLPWPEGRGDLIWDLHAQGGSIGTLRNGLTGPLLLAVRAGKIKGIDLRAALLEGRGELGKPVAPQLREFNADASTPFSEMKAHIELREGRALGRGVELQSPALHAAGEGAISLDSGKIELRMLAGVNRPAAPAELAAFAGLGVPIQIDGTWRLPRFALDFAAAGGAATGPGPGPATGMVGKASAEPSTSP
jgi:AsmA protein